MKQSRLVALTAAALAATAANSFAAALVDYSTIGTTITGEITPAITAAVPIGGTILAALLGWKLVKRFVK